ncbi:MAG: PAS domain S-box protein [bacterium]|nr:PAS domain S-box protein [bacterium]
MQKTKILIVEDEALIALNLKSILETKGYKIAEIVSSGEKAIAFVEKNPTDLILMDIVLYGELNGTTAYTKIKEKYDIPLIYLTAHSDEETIRQIKATGPYGYIQKPVNEVELHSTIEIALVKHEMEMKLKESELRYKSLSENSKNCIAIYKALNDGNDFIFIDFNKAAEEIEKIKREDLLGKSILEVFPGVKEFGFFDILQNVWRTGTPKNHPITFYSDKRITGWRENYVYKLPSGEIVTIYTDETARKQGEEALKQKNWELENTNEELHSAMEEMETANEELEQVNNELRTANNELARSQSELKAKEAMLRSVFLAAPSGIGIVMSRVLNWTNRMMHDMTGYSEEELMGQNARMLYLNDEDYAAVGKDKYAQIKEHGTGSVETRWKRKDGSIINILLCSTPLNNEDLEVGVVFTALDITKRKEAEEQLKISLQEKEILLKEIHHRVKNNLQIISSLLYLQSMNISDDKYRGQFEDIQNRVRSMALVHEKLYQSDNISKIDFHDYIKQLISNISQSYAQPHARINTIINIKDVTLDIDKAIPCSLIINELVSNCYKYAFSENNAGDIIIDFTKVNEIYSLSIGDNGVGLPPDLNILKTESLGLNLVNSLVRQLKGEMILNRDQGTTFTISF